MVEHFKNVSKASTYQKQHNLTMTVDLRSCMKNVTTEWKRCKDHEILNVTKGTGRHVEAKQEIDSYNTIIQCCKTTVLNHRSSSHAANRRLLPSEVSEWWAISGMERGRGQACHSPYPFTWCHTPLYTPLWSTTPTRHQVPAFSHLVQCRDQHE